LELKPCFQHISTQLYEIEATSRGQKIPPTPIPLASVAVAVALSGDDNRSTSDPTTVAIPTMKYHHTAGGVYQEILRSTRFSRVLATRLSAILNSMSRALGMRRIEKCSPIESCVWLVMRRPLTSRRMRYSSVGGIRRLSARDVRLENPQPTPDPVLARVHCY
jgi:hypothetical protein